MPTTSVDVVVYGGTAAGVCAAVAAAEAGASVVLLEPGRHVGGMTSGGLGYTDVGDPRALGGPATAFRAAVAEHYAVPVGRYAGPEPHVAEDIFSRWLDRAGVDVRLSAPLTGCDRRGSAIIAVRAGEAGSEREYRAAVFVDAGYEGDLLAAAGVPYRVGRENRDLHGEQFAGRQELLPGRHNMPPWISPFVGDPTGEQEGALLPQLNSAPLVDVGRGDGQVMAYGYRVCLSSAPDRVPFDAPEDDDPAYYELGRRLFRRWARDRVEVPAGRLVGLEPNLPGGLADGNSLGPFSLNVLDGSASAYPDGDAATRAAITEHHRRHTRGMLHFLAHDPEVPAAVRAEMQRWGYAPREFADTGHLPHQLYVREARRMVGATVLTEADLRAGVVPADTVALGSYHLDVREVQRSWRWVHEHPRPIGMVFTEGYLSVPVPRYGIPYQALLPRREDCANLVVPVCLSASHVAFSSIRMEPQYQMLGHAAGIAAAHAARRDGLVHDVPVANLRRSLEETGQVLTT
ncbi:FAD-dependent oxidoreductase [Isoptericola sp. NPDC056618]|uniref:FAD-dependent oxidoreductase n=1 Tax=Isoptericola sp. NPDC056618 TaxID=3345878 RepID=UPI0036CC3FF7